MMINDIDDKFEPKMTMCRLIEFIEEYSKYKPFKKSNRNKLKKLVLLSSLKEEVKMILGDEILRRLYSKTYSK